MRPLLRALLAVGAALALTACGESDLEAGVSGNGTGGFASVGRVDGFGSAYVEGERLDDRDAAVRIDEDPAASRPATLSGLSIGAQVVASAADGALVGASVGAEAIGMVDAVGPSVDDVRWITVLGQRVVVADPVLRPVIAGFGAGDLRTQRLAEVHGLRRANGDIVATRIEQRASAPLRLAGTVRQLDPVARRFSIGDLRIDYAAARLLPAGEALVEGARVVVFDPAQPPSSPRLVRVSTVRIEHPQPAEGTALRLAGYVGDFASARQFQLRGVAVDAGGAQFAEGGTAADLRDDVLVRVGGRVQGGRLVAERVQVLRSAADLAVSLQAQVSAFSSDGKGLTFRLRGATVQVDEATTFVGGTAANLGNGVSIAAAGDTRDGVLALSRITFADPSPVMAGQVADRTADGFRLPPFARPVRIGAGTVVRGGTLADVVVGRRVRVSGTPAGTAFDAAEIVLLDGNGMPTPATLVGVVGDVSPADGRFVLDRTTVAYDFATRFAGGPTGSAADLVEEQLAIVRGTQVGGVFVAAHVDVRPGLTDDNGVYGYVTAFATPADFRVSGQRVDASKAGFVGGTAVDLRASRYVLVEGQLVGTTLVASRVELLPD